MATSSTVVRLGNLNRYNTKLLEKITGMLSETDARLNEMLEGAPESFDTLREIGTYLQSHQDEYTALLTALGGKAASADLTAHTGNTDNHVSALEKADWNAAKTHADKAHAPANAERNVIAGIQINGQELAADGDRIVNIAVPAVDAELSLTSGNAIQNMAVKSALDTVNSSASVLSNRVSVIESRLEEEITEADIEALFSEVG